MLVFISRYRKNFKIYLVYCLGALFNGSKKMIIIYVYEAQKVGSLIVFLCDINDFSESASRFNNYKLDKLCGKSPEISSNLTFSKFYDQQESLKATEKNDTATGDV